MAPFQSWGRFPQVEQNEVPLFWSSDFPRAARGSVLPVGLGRSYGDVCLNERNTVCLTGRLNRFLAFDAGAGVLKCEAGTSLAAILQYFVPRGWFLPVTPGTKFVTVGGAIANDVHGKNHHVAGTFGRFVRRFQLVRSDGVYDCSSKSNPDLYSATIGGLGLTGFISWAEIQLRPVGSSQIKMESVKFCGLPEFTALSREFEDREYTVAWIDCLSTGSVFPRGIFMTGDHARDSGTRKSSGGHPLKVPCNLPAFALNRFSVALFNAAYYQRQRQKRVFRTVDYEPFFYPLDAILNWNRIYGRQGLTQFQCCIPHQNASVAITELLRVTAKSGLGSFLAILKVCGNIASPGMMSFPHSGITLALDFPIRSNRTESLVRNLNQVTLEADGRVYPAKDAFMTPEQYRRFYPRLSEFRHFVDPAFSSNFWRRVTVS